MQPHTHFFTKTVEYICNACSNFIVVTKQEILVISLTDLFSAASRRHNDVILLPAIRRVSGNDFVPAGHAVHRAVNQPTDGITPRRRPCCASCQTHCRPLILDS